MKNPARALRRELQRHHFNPLKEIIEVIPQLPPADQARVCLDLMKYLYSKPRALKNPGNREIRKVIEATPITAGPELTEEELLELSAVAQGE